MNMNPEMPMRKLLRMGLVALGCYFFNVTVALAAAPPGMLGITVKLENDWPTITVVHENLPASREGLRAGDRIIRIDGQSTQNESL